MALQREKNVSALWLLKLEPSLTHGLRNKEQRVASTKLSENAPSEDRSWTPATCTSCFTPMVEVNSPSVRPARLSTSELAAAEYIFFNE